MVKNKEDQETELIIQSIAEALKNIKGEDIIGLDISKLNTTICRHYIICHAESSTRVKSLAEEVERKIKKEYNMSPNHREGYENAQWILLDFADIIVHIFQKEYRLFYNLEDLWADGIKRNFSE